MRSRSTENSVYAAVIPAVLLRCALALVLIASSPGHGAETGGSTVQLSPGPVETSTASPAAPAKPRLSWENGVGKSYLIPALEIIAFDALLNAFDRAYFGGNDF